MLKSKPIIIYLMTYRRKITSLRQSLFRSRSVAAADVDVLFRSSRRSVSVSELNHLIFLSPSSPLRTPLFVEFVGVVSLSGPGRDPDRVVVRWWRTLTRSTKRRRKKRTKTGPRKNSSSSTLRTRWWCEAPATSRCKQPAGLAGGLCPWNKPQQRTEENQPSLVNC